MKTGWEKYASEKRYVQKGYFRKHSDGGSGRKARETSRRDSVQQSRKEIEKTIEWFGKVVELTEDVIYTGEENGESKVGIGEPIQSSGERCSEVGSKESGSRSSRSRNGKVRKSKDGKNGASRKEEG